MHFYEQVKSSLPAACLPLKEPLKALTCHAGVPPGSHTYLLSDPGEKSPLNLSRSQFSQRELIVPVGGLCKIPSGKHLAGFLAHGILPAHASC